MVNTSGDSACNYTVPFSVYRSLFGLLGPLLLRLVLHLSQAGRPQNSFNHSLLCSSSSPRTSPSISPSLHDLLDPSQRAFVPGGAYRTTSSKPTQPSTARPSAASYTCFSCATSRRLMTLSLGATCSPCSPASARRSGSSTPAGCVAGRGRKSLSATASGYATVALLLSQFSASSRHTRILVIQFR
jgi:hypothetical protein